MVLQGQTAETVSDSKSDSLERFVGSEVSPPTNQGPNRLYGQKSGPSGEVGLQTVHGPSLTPRKAESQPTVL